MNEHASSKGKLTADEEAEYQQLVLQEAEYQGLLDEGVFEIISHAEGPGVFVIRLTYIEHTPEGNRNFYMRNCIDPMTGRGHLEVMKDRLSDELLAWIRHETKWTSGVHGQWKRNRDATNLNFTTSEIENPPTTP